MCVHEYHTKCNIILFMLLHADVRMRTAQGKLFIRAKMLARKQVHIDEVVNHL